MKRLLQFFALSLLLKTTTVIAQESAYLKDITNQIQASNDKESIRTILDIPYDKAIANIKTYENLVDEAIRLSLKINDSMSLADAYQKKALVLHFTTQIEDAIKVTLSSIHIYEILNAPIKIGAAYCDLGWRLKYLDIDRAFNYMKQGINILEEYNAIELIHPAYDNLGVLYGIKSNWDNALWYHQKSLGLKKQLGDSIGIPFGYSHLANVYLKTNKFTKAEMYLDSSLNIRKRRNDIYGITDTQLYLGDLFYAKKEYNTAIKHFEEGYALANINGYHPLKKYASEYLYKSHQKLNDFEEALEYYQLFTHLKDSIINVETNGKINQLEIEFQTEKKEKEILSQRANIAEQDLKLNKKNTQLLGLSLLMLTILGLGYLIYNQQKLKNKQLKKENELKDALARIETQNELQEQRLRISRDLHDNIGAQLTFVISSLDNIQYVYKNKENELSKKLERISMFTKNTIYQLRDTIWAMNKSEITIEDLKSRIVNYIDTAKIASQNISFKFNIQEENQSFKMTSIEGVNYYRILQEAIHNAIKYAEASLVNVYVKFDEALQLVVEDNGKGFNVNQESLGNGLNNMKKRAMDIGAELTINSFEGEGTTVEVRKRKNT